jgi:uncharacterized membrane protein
MAGHAVLSRTGTVSESRSMVVTFSGPTRVRATIVRSPFRCALLSLTLLLLAPLASAAAQCCYEVTGVIRGPNCPSGGTMRVTVLGMNDIGHVVGYVEPCAGSSGTKRPFVWTEELGVMVLPLPPLAASGEAVAINNVEGLDGLGTIAATLTHIGNEGQRAYRYKNGTWTILPPQPGFSFSAARGINDAGQIIGSRSTSSGLVGFRWQNGTFTEIYTNAGGTMLALDINAFGSVAGELINRPHACLWNGESVQDFGTVLGGVSAFARALNSPGGVTGGAMVPDGVAGANRLHAFFLVARTAIDIGVPEGCDTSLGVDVNDAGQVLVRSFIFLPRIDFRAFLWQNGDMHRLDELVDAPPDIVVGHAAEAINQRGDILTSGWKDGEQVGLILSPADRPVADINFDCAVNALDLFAVLGQWGPCADGASCNADVATGATFAPPGDGQVDGADLAVVLGNWAPSAP